MKKRMICMLLTIVMLVGLLPVTAFAAAATNIKVSNPVYYDSGALKSITASFGWSGGLPSGRLVLTTKYLRSEGSNGYTYGDFSDLGYYATNFDFTSFDDVLAHDQANGDLGIITYTEQKSISSSNNSMTFSFAETNIPLSINGTYYVYFWTKWGGEYYPDNLIMAIEVKNGGVSYTVADSSKGRNALSGTSNQVTSSNKYNVTVTAAENMTKTDDSGAAIQSNLNSAMTPVVFTANDGYIFPDDYAVATTNGIMVRRDNAEQITVYGTPTSNTIIILLAPTITGYRVSFDANGGEGKMETVAVVGDKYSLPECTFAAPEGYEFSGWSDGSDIYAAGATYTMPARNVTFTAQWKYIHTHTHSYTYTASDNVITETCTCGHEETATINAPTGNLSYDGTEKVATVAYSEGWLGGELDVSYEPGNVEAGAVTASITKDNAKASVQFEIAKLMHTVIYKADGAEDKTVTVEHGADVTEVPDVPNKVGYTGIWDRDSQNITTDTTINAVYTINQYTISFDTDGGSAVEPITQDYGTVVEAPAMPTKEGYTFVGWDAIPMTMPAENLTIKANWIINKYTVTYTADGKVVDTVEVEHGQDATAPEVPAKAGHTAAWDKDGKNITADTEINAVYTINKYTVTYKADGEVVDTVEVEHGKDATAPEIPAKVGHTAAWDKDGKNITADTEINAVYTINKYTVTYKADYDEQTEQTNQGGPSGIADDGDIYASARYIC